METLYWVFEYGKVFCGYMFFMFLWPSVVFGGHLKGKDKRYQFSFCVIVQVMVANTVVLGLGLLHMLDQRIIRGVFYGVFFGRVLQKVILRYRSGMLNDGFHSFYSLIMGTSGIKLFLYRIVTKYLRWIKERFKKFSGKLRRHFTEYILLLAVILYGMVYFSYGPFQTYNYGFPDVYVHHQWIYGLLQGEIFSNGVYPEAMHCFVYCIHTLFGIRVYSILHLAAGIHIAVFLLCAYSFMREVFEWRYSPIFVLILYLALDIENLDFIFAMSRMQWMIPQDFGYYTEFLCVLYLIRYLKNDHRVQYKGRMSKGCWDENLFLFMMSLAASIAIHFYITIMAFFLCASFALFSLKKIFVKKRFIPLVTAVLCGVLIAVLPMAGALAQGKAFEGSIYWALNVMNGGDSENTEDEEVLEEGEGTGRPGESDLSKENTEQEILEEETNTKVSFFQKLKNNCSILYWSGYAALYGKPRSNWMLASLGLTVILYIGYCLGRMFYKWVLRRSVKNVRFVNYMPLMFASVLFMFVSRAYAFGLPQLISGDRVCTSEHMLLFAAAILPIDMFFLLLRMFATDAVIQALSIFGTVGICYGIAASGHYHGYLGCNLTRYNPAVMVTNSIIENFPEESYTIVSPVDELYQVAQYGYHEELLTFVKEIQERDYKLPTQYVFLFIEKKPILYAQPYFMQGPKWLGDTKHLERYPGISKDSEIKTTEISEQEAKKDILLYSLLSESYLELESRVILESRAYIWCQNFMKLHPFEVNVYYEDDDFVCYYFKQNPYALYDLAIEGWNRTDGVEW